MKICNKYAGKQLTRSNSFRARVISSSFIWMSLLLSSLSFSALALASNSESIEPIQQDAQSQTQTPLALALIPTTTLSVPLFASHDSHHVHVYIGSPPQRRIVIVDTGSRLLVFPCEPCRQCGSNHVSKSFYDPYVSSTDVPSSCGQCVFDGTATATDTTAASKKHQKKQQLRSQRLNQCRDNKCTFKQSFTEGSSMSGYEVSDITWLGTSNKQQSIRQYMYTAIPMTFGCQTSESGLIASQFADGILGLSLALKEENIVTKMFEEGSIPSYAFSICLTRDDGILSLGGTSLMLYSDGSNYDNNNNNNDNKGDGKGNEDGNRNRKGDDTKQKSNLKPRHLEPMQTVPISKDHGYYSINVINFQMGSKSLQLQSEQSYFPFSTTTSTSTSTSTNKEIMSTIFNNGKGTIVDSGTSDMYLPKRISNEFRSLWKEFTNGIGHSNNVIMYSYDEFQKLPNVTFTLENGYEWTVQPWNYMEPLGGSGSASTSDTSGGISDSSNQGWSGEMGWINRIYLDESSGCVLGANAMFGHDILFDIANGQIGIAEAICS